ncbi:MAG: hypothetical protein ASARMPRED_000983 [Alectoria sarmentosa]|nr:MAG: hypothetical protein ASARMPRED_000983 [Alectoria sarmentosa]
MSVFGVHLSPEHGFSKTSQPSITLLKGLGVEGDCHLGKTTQHLWRLKDHASEPNLRQVHLIQSELFDEPDFHGGDGVRIQAGQMGENVTTTGIDLLALKCGTKLRFVDKRHTQAAFDNRNLRILHENSFVFFKYLAISLLQEAVFMSMGYRISWYRILLAISGSINESLFVYMVGFWPIMVFGGLLMSLGIDSSLHSIVLGTMACLNLILLSYLGYTRKSYLGEHAVITVTGLRHPCKKVEKFRPGLQEKCLVRGGERSLILKRKAGVMAVVMRGGTVKPDMTIIVEPTLWFKELPVLR